MIRTLAFSSLLSLASLSACMSSEPSDGVEVSLSSNGKEDSAGSADVSWRYQDYIGRGLEFETSTAGSISLQFTGGLLPVVGKTWWGGDKLPLQTATLRLEVPSHDNPDALVARTFFVRFAVVEKADGTKVYSTEPSNGVIVDASLSGAKQRFDSTYRADTQASTPGAWLRADESAHFVLRSNASGTTFTLDTLRLARTKVLSDFAKHTTIISLE